MDAVTSAPSRVRQASGRGRGADTARWTRARFPSSSLGLRALLSPSPSGARSLDRRFGPVSRRRLPNEPKSGRGRISALARVGPGCPATPGPSQPPRRDGAWPQHEVIIGAADGQNNSSVLTCLKNRNAGMLLVVMVVARRVRTLSLSSSLNNYSLRLQDTAIHKPIMRISSCL